MTQEWKRISDEQKSNLGIIKRFSKYLDTERLRYPDLSDGMKNISAMLTHDPKGDLVLSELGKKAHTLKRLSTVFHDTYDGVPADFEGFPQLHLAPAIPADLQDKMEEFANNTLYTHRSDSRSKLARQQEWELAAQMCLDWANETSGPSNSSWNSLFAKCCGERK
ncbi:hypothetical protein I302_106571 [Kwoniella bestiolae CBS 10118]|uniref:Uncharacterized protein n=1 Tax=Kwoniella bestiolae CBS 10118 TaxID=1296100 RepID=A0A1B9G118_9TREE|nr:hypothetical protein I302_06167 [Kwoniella bestiolae CBS 10118]OCF24706.1 hypothetical protein I302_06167 [Kwoniella bestiolae CBS 10118]